MCISASLKQSLSSSPLAPLLGEHNNNIVIVVVPKHVVLWSLMVDLTGSLHDALAAFAPPHHQRRHEQRDQDGHHDEGPQDAVGRVPEEASGQRAVVEVVFVDPDEELVHQPVGPEALHLQSHQVGAVRQLPVQPAGWQQEGRKR